ncbi:MAG: hypothetical protein LBO09_03320 [Candidatus Peribacteria bacterium]|nr:hypothetical protein [Candidatus Peribacteria bacterium]
MNVNTNKEVVVYSNASEVANKLSRDLETKSDTLVGTYEQRAEIFNVNKERIKNLKKEYKQLRGKAKGGKSPEAKSALSIVYSDIDRVVKKIEAIEKHFNKLKKLDHVDFSVYAKELKDYQNNLESGKIDQAIQEASLGKKVSIWTPIHSPADAKDALVKDAEVARDNVDKAKLLRSILTLNLFNDKQRALESFINGTMADPDKVAFVQENRAALKNLEATDQAVYNQLVYATGLDALEQKQCKDVLYPSYASPQRRGKEYGSRDEALAHNGIFGLIDYATEKVQMDDPKSQKFYQNAGNIALTVGGVVLGFKALQTLRYKCFGSEEKKNSAHRGWVLAPAGLLLATGGNPKQIFTGGPFMEKIVGLFGDGKSSEATAVVTGGGLVATSSSKQTPEAKETTEKAKLIHGTAVPATVAVFVGNSYKDLDGMLEKKDDKYRIKADQYDALLADLKAKQQQDQQDHNLKPKERVALEQKIDYLTKIGKKDEQNLIHQGMVAMGLDKKLEENKDNVDKDVVENDITEYISRLLTIGSEKFDKISDDSHKQEMFARFLSTGKPTLKELREAGVFILEIEDTSHTKDQIDDL